MKLLLFLFLNLTFAVAQYVGTAGPPFCLVTRRQLFSHGNYIRDLNDKEMLEFDVYKNKLVEYQQALSLVFTNLANITGGLPLRPPLPAFCTSPDTTLFILGHCTVQNYKVYVIGKYARDLEPTERQQLDEFANRLRENNFKPPQAEFPSNETTSTPTRNELTLNFCQEL